MDTNTGLWDGRQSPMPRASQPRHHPMRTTRRGRFLLEMDRVIPWPTLTALAAPHCTGTAFARPDTLERMLRIFLLQRWFRLSDAAAQDEVRDSHAMHHFARIDSAPRLPDEADIRTFRRLLTHKRLAAEILRCVDRALRDHRLLVRAGSLVDATLLIEPRTSDIRGVERPSADGALDAHR